MLPTTLPSVHFYYYSHYILPSVHIIFLTVSLDLLPSRQWRTMTLFLNLQCLVKSLMDSKRSINVSYINKKVRKVKLPGLSKILNILKYKIDIPALMFNA